MCFGKHRIRGIHFLCWKKQKFCPKKRCFVKQSFVFYVLFNTKYLPIVIEKRKKIHVIKKIKIQNSLFFCVFSLFSNPTNFHKFLLKFHQFFPNKKFAKKPKCVFQIFDNSTFFPLRQKTQFFFRIFKQNLSKELFIFLFLGFTTLAQIFVLFRTITQKEEKRETQLVQHFSKNCFYQNTYISHSTHSQHK